MKAHILFAPFFFLLEYFLRDVTSELEAKELRAAKLAEALVLPACRDIG